MQSHEETRPGPTSAVGPRNPHLWERMSAPRIPAPIPSAHVHEIDTIATTPSSLFSDFLLYKVLSIPMGRPAPSIAISAAGQSMY